jgi:hypothetical protein
MFDPPADSNDFLASHVRMLLASYRRFVSESLIDHDDSDWPRVAREVYRAPFVLLSHNTAPDPIFNYANQCAMDLFEMDWQTITSLHSRKSAEPVKRAERDRLLAAVSANNFIDDYSGVRISSTGLRFFIPRAVVWNVVDDRGEPYGQAATFDAWEFIEG